MGFKMEKILVAKDLSEQSSEVIRYALELAAKFHAQVYVLHVMPTVDSSVLNMVAMTMGADKLAKLNAQNEAEVAEKTRQQLHDIIKTEAALLKEDLLHPPLVEVHHGEPVAMILDVAERLKVDMIVIGSHSKGKLHYAFLGSVATKVLDKSHRPVVMVPPQKIK